MAKRSLAKLQAYKKCQTSAALFVAVLLLASIGILIIFYTNNVEYLHSNVMEPNNSIVKSTLTLPDVPNDLAYTDAIHYLFNEQIISGYEDGNFKPFKQINRAELAKILVEAKFGKKPSSATGCFPDVTGEWFEPYICEMVDNGWAQGYEDGTFRPAETVTRAEALKMILLAQGIKPARLGTSVPYLDITSTDWYTPYISAADSLGILLRDNIYFKPDWAINRGEISQMLYQTIQANPNKG